MGIRSGVSSRVGNGADLSDGEPADGPEQGARGGLRMAAATRPMQSPRSVQHSAACLCTWLAL